MAPQWLPNSHPTAPSQIPEGTIWHSLLLKSVVKVAGPGETNFLTVPQKTFLNRFHPLGGYGDRGMGGWIGRWGGLEKVKIQSSFAA